MTPYKWPAQELLDPTAHYDSELQNLRSQLDSARLENEKLRHDVAFLKTALDYEEQQAKQLAKQLAQRQERARREYAGMQAEDKRRDWGGVWTCLAYFALGGFLCWLAITTR